MTDPCASLQAEVDNLSATLGRLEDEYVTASPARRLVLMREIRDTQALLKVAQADLAACRHPPPPPPPPLPDVRWNSIGPGDVNGRILSLAVDPTNGAIVYAGSANGGVFKTTDGGAAWTPLWNDQASLAVGAVAVAPSNPSVVYAGTGQWWRSAYGAFQAYPGVGVYRSDDAGATWRLLSPIPSDEISAIAVDPGNADRLFVAGNLGLHRSTTGGASWDLLGSNHYGVFDGNLSHLAMDPTDGDRLLVGVQGSAIRDGGVWRTIDGGGNWTHLNNGLPGDADTPGPRIALGVKGAHGRWFVAVKLANQIYTSTNFGSSFTQQPTFSDFNPDPDPDQLIGVDPTDESVLIAGDVWLYRSTDGGKTWSKIGDTTTTPDTYVHEDKHAIAFDPADHRHIYVATDDGVSATRDGGDSWTSGHYPAYPKYGRPALSNGLVVAQCYNIGVTQTADYACAITTQDNRCYESTGGDFGRFVIDFPHEGGWVQYDPSTSKVAYANTWLYGLVRTVDGGDTWVQLPVDFRSMLGVSMALAGRTTSLLLGFPQDGSVLKRSTDRGDSWTDVLTPAHPISAVRFQPTDDGHAYAASEDGTVWHSSDAGVTWTELDNTGLPLQRIHDIQVSWSDPLQIYLAYGQRISYDVIGYRPLWRGAVGSGSAASWTDVSGTGGTAPLPTYGLTGLVIDPADPSHLYVSSVGGPTAGVFVSRDGGGSWTRFSEGLPNCLISHLTFRVPDRTLHLSTMGRGAYRRRI